MYRIYVDGKSIHNPNLFDAGLELINPTVTMALNTHGQLTFAIPPDHPRKYDILTPNSIISIKNEDGIFWRGRLIQTTRNINNIVSAHCEGEAAFLCDSIQRPFVYRGSVLAFLNRLINAHNSNIRDERKKFELRNIEIEDANQYIVRSSETPMTTWDILQKKLVGTLGGYFVFTPREDGPTYIDYLDGASTTSGQTVKWGKNVIDISDIIDLSSVITVLVPYGAKYEEGDPNYTDPPQDGTWSANRLTIESVNGGRSYIENQDAIQKFGRIVGYKIWDDVTVASNLKSKAEAYLNEAIKSAYTITLTAVDYNFIDRNEPALKIAELVPVVSKVHNINQSLICTKIVIPLMNLANARVTLGAATPAITDPATVE